MDDLFTLRIPYHQVADLTETAVLALVQTSAEYASIADQVISTRIFIDSHLRVEVQARLQTTDKGAKKNKVKKLKR